ncbi:MAG: hypothetical protein IPP51_02070 [Bacteroidetes bacterium]|nr:hypothetical protein [Bacteroidota bacterium]
MKKLYFILFAMILISAGCKKDEPVTSEPTPVGCSSVLPNKLSCKVAGQEWCANTTCFGDLAIIMTINGVNSSTSSLTLELEDFTPGTYQIREDRNHILYTSGNAWESTNDNPGTLIITSNDTSTNHLTGTFTVTLRSPLTGNLSITNGVINLFYTE